MTSVKIPNSLKVGLFVGLLALLGAGFYFRNGSGQKDAVTVAVADIRDQQITELQQKITSQTDSILILKSTRDDLIKLIAAHETQLKKNKPNDEKILATYKRLTDSAALAIFMQRYGKFGSSAPLRLRNAERWDPN